MNISFIVNLKCFALSCLDSRTKVGTVTTQKLSLFHY